LLSLNSFGAEQSVGRIVEVKGEGFISRDGKTKEVRKGDQLYPNSEIVVERSGQITFTDNADHRFHLGNASSVAVGANGVELRAGDIWFQSLNKTESYKVTTANAIIEYQGGEAILSYDVSKGKTQLMVINGIMKLSNSRTVELNMTVAEGNFSFIDSNYDEGAPRDPTPVGEKTYKQLVMMFKGIEPLDKKSEAIFKSEGPAREIASIRHEETPELKPVATLPELAAYTDKLISPPVAVKRHRQTRLKQEVLVVQIFGLKKATAKESVRMPASVKEEPAIAAPVDSAKTKETDSLLNALKNL
jgi:hypothetical protein